MSIFSCVGDLRRGNFSYAILVTSTLLLVSNCPIIPFCDGYVLILIVFKYNFSCPPEHLPHRHNNIIYRIDKDREL